MPRNIQRRDVLKGAGAAGMAAVAGCLGDDAVGDQPMAGILMPESGDLGTLGATIRDGALLAQTVMERQTDIEIDVRTEDTQTDPEAGISAAERLVDAGFPAVVGPAASNVNLPVCRQVFIPSQVVGCSPSSTTPELTTLDDDDYIYRTCPSDALQGPVMAQVARERRDAQTTSTLYLNDDYGQALEENYIQAFEDDGGEVLERVPFEPEQASYTGRLEEALEPDPDILMIVGFPQSGIQLFRDFYADFDTGVDIIIPDGLRDDTLPDEVGNDMANVIGTAPLADGPASDFFEEEYESEYDASPTVFNGQAYDALAVLVLANVAAGTTNDGTDVRDNIRTVANPNGESFTGAEIGDAIEAVQAGDDIEYLGVSSDVVFDENGDMEAITYELFAFEDREVVTVDTIDFEA